MSFRVPTRFQTALVHRMFVVLVAMFGSASQVIAQQRTAGPATAQTSRLIGTPMSLAGTQVSTGRAVATAASEPARVAGPAVSVTASSAADATEDALRALAGHVRRMSDPRALRTAFEAYFNYRAARPEAVRKPYLYFIDLGLDNRTRRGYVFDMESLQLIDGPFTVAHGNGSSRSRDGVPTRFSNRSGSKASSLGLYLAQETYGFGGKSGGRAYRSTGLRLRGESGEFNSAARSRGIVAHGAPYVTGGRAGRSEGCPAMEVNRARRLLPMLANGGVVFIFSANDAKWLREDPWVRS
jgi:L,D-transpeptidase-like protein